MQTGRRMHVPCVYILIGLHKLGKKYNIKRHLVGPINI